MQPKRNNKILIIIIGLLIIIAPLTIMSIYFNFSDIPSKKEEVKMRKNKKLKITHYIKMVNYISMIEIIIY